MARSAPDSCSSLIADAAAAQQLGACLLEPDGLGSRPSPGAYHLSELNQDTEPFCAFISPSVE